MAIKAQSIRQGVITLLLLSFCLAGCINDGDSGSSKTDGIARKGDVVAAKVGDTVIYKSDVLRAAQGQQLVKAGEALTPNNDIFQSLLDELIDQRLLKLAALDAKVQNAPEVKRQLAEARERILATYFVENHLRDKVTEEKLREMYKAQSSLRQNGTEAKVRLMTVKTQAGIKTAAAKLAAGEDFLTLAHSLAAESPSGLRTGDIGFVSRAMLPDEIGSVVFSTAAGARSKPFETQDGWHIVEVESFRRPPEASFESMRAQLLRYKTYSEIQSLMTKLRDDGAIEIVPIPMKTPSETKNE